MTYNPIVAYQLLKDCKVLTLIQSFFALYYFVSIMDFEESNFVAIIFFDM